VNTSRKWRWRDADIRSAVAAAARRSVTIGGGGVSKMSAAAHSSIIGSLSPARQCLSTPHFWAGVAPIDKHYYSGPKHVFGRRSSKNAVREWRKSRVDELHIRTATHVECLRVRHNPMGSIVIAIRCRLHHIRGKINILGIGRNYTTVGLHVIK